MFDTEVEQNCWFIASSMTYRCLLNKRLQQSLKQIEEFVAR